jgi:hypothetical protein
MSEAAQAFARALDEERAAALRADFDALLRVQEEKRALLPELKQGLAPDIAADLSERARKNLVLLRTLHACVQGYLGIEVEDPTYTAQGQAAGYSGLSAPPSVRGKL